MVGVAARRSIEQIEKTSTVRPFQDFASLNSFQINSKQTTGTWLTVDWHRAEFARPGELRIISGTHKGRFFSFTRLLERLRCGSASVLKVFF
jgi:hypothetical protein